MSESSQPQASEAATISSETADALGQQGRPKRLLLNLLLLLAPILACLLVAEVVARVYYWRERNNLEALAKQVRVPLFAPIPANRA